MVTLQRFPWLTCLSSIRRIFTLSFRWRRFFYLWRTYLWNSWLREFTANIKHSRTLFFSSFSLPKQFRKTGVALNYGLSCHAEPFETLLQHTDSLWWRYFTDFKLSWVTALRRRTSQFQLARDFGLPLAIWGNELLLLGNGTEKSELKAWRPKAKDLDDRAA